MTQTVAPSAVLFLDCTQRESVLVLAPSPSDGGAPFARRFDAQSKSGEGERFWLELAGLFDEAGLSAAALSGVAVATGPGGFTGLRVSIACAKAIAFARGIPAVGVPSATVFAASDAARGGRGPWLVALASKAGSAWATAVAGSPEEITAGAHGFCEGAIVAEDAFARLAADTAARGGAVLADEHLDPVLAACVARTGAALRGLSVEPHAARALAHGALARVVPSGGPGGDDARGRSTSFGSPFALEPLYAREPEAVTNWRLRRADRGS
jgi:tRNA threonylcarbamoyl adenosine modification protein YeaZ